MLDDLFINTLLLISFTFVGGNLSREVPKFLKNNIYEKVLIGLAGGILAFLMMIYSIQVPGTNTLLDLRALSMVIVSTIGGFISTVITGIIILIYRIGNFGVNQSSIFAAIHIILYIASFYIIDITIKQSSKKWFYKVAVAEFILVSTFLYLLRNVDKHYIITFSFALVVALAGTLEYFLLQYTKNSNDLYRRYKHESSKDFLTGLNNTRNFDKLLNLNFEKVLENNDRLSCLMIDIDHFKKVNDTYGHAVGDLVLKELALILSQNCRSFDIIGRVGGEEFCALLLDCDISRCFEIGVKIRNAVKLHRFPIGENRYLSITVSVGCAAYPDTVENLEEIKKKADAALYTAKESGRDKVCSNDYCVVDQKKGAFTQ